MQRIMKSESEIEMEGSGSGGDDLDDLTDDKLFDAVEQDSIEDARFCIFNLKADVNSRNQQGDKPLHKAVERGCGAMVRLLVLNGAEIGVENSSKLTPINIALNKEYHDIANMLSEMETTSWRPGSDPALLLIPRDNEYSEPKAKESLIFERSQFALQLEEAGLKHYIPNFEINNITYLQFLRLDDNCLSQIGISVSEDRHKILGIIKMLSERKWQKNSVLPIFMQKDITSSEVSCILNNLQLHTQILSSSVESVRSQIEKNPGMLRRNMEMNTIENLASAITEASEVTKTLVGNINKLSLALGGIQHPKNSSKSVFRPMCIWFLGVMGAASCGFIASYLIRRMRK